VAFSLAYGFVLALLPLGIAYLLWRKVGGSVRVPRRLALVVVLAGLVLGALAVYAERLVLSLTGLTLTTAGGGAGPGGALLAMFVFAAPLEEALKVLAVWPVYSTGRMRSAHSGLTYAVCAGAGFASAEGVLAVAGAPITPLDALRLSLGVLAHTFFAGVWGYALGSKAASKRRWFALSWIGAMLLHGLYDHIVFGRGPALLVLVLPLLAAMALITWTVAREIAPASVPSSGRLSLLSSLPEPPSLNAMRQALKRSDRPLMLHWIAIGALVTLGVSLSLLALAVYLGHRVGIDFALADEADVRSSGPLVLLGIAVLSAFPFAGYLVARASAATSVLEPAMGAGVAIVMALAALSATAPVAVVFALAVAPVAFVLACGGAWFGVGK
jgi:RsiW-degrading membrane proteinase PrsW (M82 family)